MITILYIILLAYLVKSLWDESMAEVKQHAAELDAKKFEASKPSEVQLTPDQAVDQLTTFIESVRRGK